MKGTDFSQQIFFMQTKCSVHQRLSDLSVVLNLGNHYKVIAFLNIK